MMAGWRRSPAIAGLVVASFLIVQLVVPISRFGDDSTRRFGWQMFSLARPSPQFVVTTSTGDIEIALSDYMARVRADVDVTLLLPPHLCSVIPGADYVTWEDGSHQC